MVAALRPANVRDHTCLASATETQWAAMAALALKHRLGPLLHSRTDLPMSPAVLTHLRESALRAAHRSRLLVEFSRILSARTIDVIVLKGRHLALTAYPSPSVRPMSDIDVIVRDTHLDDAWAAAIELGYRPTNQMPLGRAVRVWAHPLRSAISAARLSATSEWIRRPARAMS